MSKVMVAEFQRDLLSATEEDPFVTWGDTELEQGARECGMVLREQDAFDGFECRPEGLEQALKDESTHKQDDLTKVYSIQFIGRKLVYCPHDPVRLVPEGFRDQLRSKSIIERLRECRGGRERLPASFEDLPETSSSFVGSFGCFQMSRSFKRRALLESIRCHIDSGWTYNGQPVENGEHVASHAPLGYATCVAHRTWASRWYGQWTDVCVFPTSSRESLLEYRTDLEDVQVEGE